jgi:pimeloyl-ACP methyl ester carboxylesterase
MRIPAIGSLLLAFVVLFAASISLAGATQTGLHMTACTQGHRKAAAECGTFGVYENRAAHSGRIIPLAVVVLKAKHPSRDAIAFIEGGPGVAAVPDAPFVADGDDPVLAPFRDTYDMLFVDNRGMGTSNPTGCNISPYSDIAAYFLQIWPTQILSGCYKRYAAHSDPSAYNTNNAVDDLDDVREALGYRKLLLYGGSYGSFFSFVYIRRHPDRVKAAVLEGIAAPHFQPFPGAPDGAQTALDDLAAKCSKNVPCRTTFPLFMEHFRALLARFANGPVLITVRNTKTKQLQPVRLSKEVLVDRVRETLYEPDAAAFVPYIVERAYHFDYVPLGRMIDVWSQFIARGQDAGTNLAYRCADFDPFISDAELQAASRASFTSDLRVRAERQACAIWKVTPMPAAFNDPVRSSLPILMLDGSDDPVTPPKYAAGALRYLSNAKLVLVRGAGHGVFTACTNRIMIAFIRDGLIKNVRASACSAAFTAPPFATSMAKWQDYQLP